MLTKNIIGYTHQDFADCVGIYRETVSQTLKEFKSAGIIETGRKQISILDLSALSDIAAY